MQFILKHRVQCLQWYVTLVVSFASYPCNEHKTHVGRPKCESDTSIVRYVIYTSFLIVFFSAFFAKIRCELSEIRVIIM